MLHVCICWHSHQFPSAACVGFRLLLLKVPLLFMQWNSFLKKKNKIKVVQQSSFNSHCRPGTNTMSSGCCGQHEGQLLPMCKSLPNIDFDQQMALAHFHLFSNNSHPPTTSTPTLMYAYCLPSESKFTRFKIYAGL